MSKYTKIFLTMCLTLILLFTIAIVFLFNAVRYVTDNTSALIQTTAQPTTITTTQKK